MNMRYVMVCIDFVIFFNFCNIKRPCTIPLPPNVWFVVEPLCLHKQQMSESCMFRTCTKNFSLFIIALVKSCRKRGGGVYHPWLPPPPAENIWIHHLKEQKTTPASGGKKVGQRGGREDGVWVEESSRWVGWGWEAAAPVDWVSVGRGWMGLQGNCHWKLSLKS